MHSEVTLCGEGKDLVHLKDNPAVAGGNWGEVKGLHTIPQTFKKIISYILCAFIFPVILIKQLLEEFRDKR